jgi:putative peptidoglycan lipid II flippase
MAEINSVENTKEKRKNTQHLIQSMVLLFVMFGVSKGISLLQTFIIARAFGVSNEWDAYVAAARVPDLIVLLMGGGALGFAFIPVFSGLLTKGDTDRAWKLASQVVNTIFVAALAASVFAFLFTPMLINRVIAPDFPAETAALSVSLMRILLIGTLIFSVSGMVMSILQSHNHFLLPALAPILNDVGILFGVFFLIGRFGVHGMVYGAVLGAILHFAIQIPGLLRFKARWHFELGWNDPLLRQVIRLMIPRLAGLGLSSINVIIMTNFGSRLGVGATSAIDWGWRIMQIPQTLIGTAMGIVIFPTLSALSEVQDESGKRAAMSGALRFIMIATIPSAIGLILIGQPLLSLLEGGAFDASATAIVYGALRAFALGIVVHSMLEIVARSFYADKDTVTPLIAAFVGAVINVILAYLLTGIATGQANAFNVWGIAAANSFSVAVEVVILLVILRQRWHGIDENTVTATTMKTIMASLAMGLAVIAVEFTFTLLGLSDRVLYMVAQVCTQIILGGIVFVIAALLLQMKEIRDIINMILRRRPKVELESVQSVG